MPQLIDYLEEANLHLEDTLAITDPDGNRTLFNEINYDGCSLKFIPALGVEQSLSIKADTIFFLDTAIAYEENESMDGKEPEVVIIHSLENARKKLFFIEKPDPCKPACKIEICGIYEMEE